MTSPIDCVVVGYNDVSFSAFAATQKKMSHHSGAYHEVMTNSILLDGERVTYMDLINRAVERSTGIHPRLNTFASPSLGVCYLQSYLIKRGFRVESLNFFTHDQARFRELLAERPRSVAITTTYYVDNAPIAEIVAFVRRHSPSTRIIVGGPHIFNLAYDLTKEMLPLVFDMIGADVYVIDSQGEKTLSETLACLAGGGALSGVPNLYYRDERGDLQQTHREPESNEMDSNSVDWSVLDRDLITPLAYMRTARSCPFSCSFCNYPTLAGKHVVTGLEKLETELEYLHSIGTHYLVFVDDTFNVPLPRFKKLLRIMIDRQWNFEWISFFRCSNADEEAFDLMAKSGCIGVFLGIESGDQTILEYMEKHAKVERYQWGVEQLRRRNIVTFASIICGFPGETRETAAHSLEFLETAQPTFFNVQLYYHDPRSPIARRSEEFAIKGGGYSWQHRGMDWRLGADLAKQAFRNVRGSVPLSLYNFSIWSLPYLLSKGVTMQQLIEFGKITREMLVAGFDDLPQDFRREEQRLTDLFSASGLVHRLRARQSPAAALHQPDGASAPA
jgi:radical SAM PhpK family P-methyltransferase